MKVGIVNVAIGGCKIELFEKDPFRTHAAMAPNRMTNAIAIGSGVMRSAGKWLAWTAKKRPEKAVEMKKRRQ